MGVTTVTARVRVAPDVCEGCRCCLEACPTDVFRFDDSRNQAIARYPDDCCACLLCLEDCPPGAITVDPRLTIRGFVSVYDELDPRPGPIRPANQE